MSHKSTKNPLKIIPFTNFHQLSSQQQMAPQTRPGMPMAAPGMSTGMPMMQQQMPMAGQQIPQQPILTQQMPQAQPANSNIQLDPFGA